MYDLDNDIVATQRAKHPEMQFTFFALKRIIWNVWLLHVNRLHRHIHRKSKLIICLCVYLGCFLYLPLHTFRSGMLHMKSLSMIRSNRLIFISESYFLFFYNSLCFYAVLLFDTYEGNQIWTGFCFRTFIGTVNAILNTPYFSLWSLLFTHFSYRIGSFLNPSSKNESGRACNHLHIN